MSTSSTTSHAVILAVAILLPVALWGRVVAPAKGELAALESQQSELASRLQTLQLQRIDREQLGRLHANIAISQESLQALGAPLPSAAALGEELDRIASSLGGRIVRFEPGNTSKATRTVLESTKEVVQLRQRNFRVEFDCESTRAPEFLSRLHAYSTWISIRGMRVQKGGPGNSLDRVSLDLELSSIAFVPHESGGGGA